MAIKGFESKEVKEVKRYIGIAPVTVKAVNPTKTECETIFGASIAEDPVYFDTIEDRDGNTVQRAKFRLVLQLVSEDPNEDAAYVNLYFNLLNKPYTGASGKTQVIDKYGRTAWATPEELAAHSIPMYKNGPADLDKDYRPAYVGEEELMKFVRAYLWVPEPTVFDNNSQKRIPNPNVALEDCECRFDNLDKVFKGDASEVLSTLGLMPTNKVRVALGIRTNPENGRLYQDVFTRHFNKSDNKNYSIFKKEFQSAIDYAMANGRTLSTVYEAVDVHEYKVEPTVFTEQPEGTQDLPFSPSETTSPWD